MPPLQPSRIAVAATRLRPRQQQKSYMVPEDLESPKDWVIACKKANIDPGKHSIHRLRVYKSASKITWDQYLALRVLRPKIGTKEALEKVKLSLISVKYFEKAEVMLRTLPGWNRYLECLERCGEEEEGDEYQDMGPFKLARIAQKRILGLEKFSEEVAGDGSRIPQSQQDSPLGGLSRRKKEAHDASATMGSPLPQHLLAPMQRMTLSAKTPASKHAPPRSPMAPSKGPHLSSTLPKGPTSSSSLGKNRAEEHGQNDRKEPDRGRDEDNVNHALIDLLSALTDQTCLFRTVRWDPGKFSFEFETDKFKDSPDLYEAKVDGCLLNATSEKVHAIVEVKVASRDKVGNQTRKQEGAEMAAWNNTPPPTPTELIADEGMVRDVYQSVPTAPSWSQSPTKALTFFRRRLLISQCYRKISLTFAKYGDMHQKAMTQASFRPDNTDLKSYLRMHEYGEYDIFNAEHMRYLGHFIVAFTLWQAEERC